MLTPFCRVEEIRPSPVSEADFSDGVPEAKKEKKKRVRNQQFRND